jgi:hypothetical protein
MTTDFKKEVEKAKVSWKRHAGAGVLIALYAARVFGLQIPEGTETLIGALGAGIFGYGWIDRARTGPHKG